MLLVIVSWLTPHICHGHCQSTTEAEQAQEYTEAQLCNEAQPCRPPVAKHPQLVTARPGLSSGKQGVPPPPALHTVTTNTFSLQERNTNTQGSHTITYLTIKSTKHLDNQEKYFPYKLSRGSENIFFLKKIPKMPSVSPCVMHGRQVSDLCTDR